MELATLKTKTARQKSAQKEVLSDKAGWFKHLDWWLPGAVFGLAGAVYLLTVAPGLTWKNGGDDGGDLAIAAKLLGIAHPTGYPLYLLLAQPLIWFGIEPIRALNLLSGLYGALACGLLTLAVMRLLQFSLANELVMPVPAASHADKSAPKIVRKKTEPYKDWIDIFSWAGGAGAGLLLAFAPLFWSQAVIAEVYSLEAALLALSLWAIVRWHTLKQQPEADPKHGLGVVLFTLGLAAAHHRTGFLTLLAGVVFVASGLGGWSGTWGFIKSLRVADWLAGFALSIVGFVPYLYILFRGGQSPAANWLNPGWNNLSGFWDEFNATFYHNLLLVAPATQFVGRITAIARFLLTDFGVWGVILGLAGWWAAATLPRLKPFFWLALIGCLAHAVFASIYAADNSQVYLIPAYVIWAALVGIGLAYFLLQLWQVRLPNQLRIAITIGSVTLLTGLQLALNYGAVDASQDQTAQEWVAQILANAPPDAVLLTNEDKFTFGLWYEQYALNKRPDLTLVETRLLNFDWYRANLHQLYPKLKLDGQFAGVDVASQLVRTNPGQTFFEATANGLQAVKQ